MYYARINKQKVCESVFGDNKARVESNLVPLGNDDIDVIGKIWDGERWEENIVEEPISIIQDEVYETTDEEIIQAEILLNQQEILINLKNITKC